MDFFSIFQNNNLDTNNLDTKKKTTDAVDIRPNAVDIRMSVKKGNVQEDKKKEINHVSSYKNIRKGMFVKIIGVTGSYLNYYKGYFGEIKDYKREQDFAIIFLHGPVKVTILRFPIYHFIIEPDCF
jgi:hypothetical protein